MWVCFNDAFISVVQDRNQPDRVCVRARRSKHLQLLFPDSEVILTPQADYTCRVFVSKRMFCNLLRSRIATMDYTNFKNSVADHSLHELYSDFWLSHWTYQQQGRD